jgi:uncharacterized protein YchJ
MFRLQIHELLFVYCGFTLAVILFAACMHNFRRSSRERTARRALLKCRLCAFEFSDHSGAVLPRCPNCQALTERRTLSQL